MVSKINNIFSKLSNWVERNPAKVSNIILVPGEAAMVAGGVLTLNPARTWAGVQGLKAAISGFSGGDTVYDTASSHPLLKANQSYVAGGVSDWTGWAEGNIRQYGTLTVSGGIGSVFDLALSLPGLAAFKTLTIKDPPKQIHEIATQLDAIAYKEENTKPLKLFSPQGLKKALIDQPGRLIRVAAQDAKGLAAFTRDHGPTFLSEIPGSAVEQAKALKSYLLNKDSPIGTHLKEWSTSYGSFQSDSWKKASGAKKAALAVPFALNDAAEKVTDVAMLPFKGVFNVLAKPSARIADVIKKYGTDRGIDGKKVISERLQNYSEIPYMIGGLTAMGIGVASGASIPTLAMAGAVTMTGFCYAASNAYQRKSGNVPGMDLDLPVYLHRPQDIAGRFLHGINEDIPGYKELVDSIKVVLASEADYIAYLERTMKTNPGEIFAMNSDGTYSLNQIDYFRSIQQTNGTTPVDNMFKAQSDGSHVLDTDTFVKWLDENNADPENPKVEWPKNNSGQYILEGLENVGYAVLKKPEMKISIAQIVGLPNLSEWPEGALPPEAAAVIKRAKEIRAARASGQKVAGTIPVPSQVISTRLAEVAGGTNPIIIPIGGNAVLPMDLCAREIHAPGLE